MMAWLDRIPFKWLLVIALWLGVAPIVPEPHLIEKIRLLAQGRLQRPIDIFDLCLHTGPLMLLALRLWRDARRGRKPQP